MVTNFFIKAFTYVKNYEHYCGSSRLCQINWKEEINNKRKSRWVAVYNKNYSYKDIKLIC